MQHNLHIFFCTATWDGSEWLVRSDQHRQIVCRVRNLDRAKVILTAMLAAELGRAETDVTVKVTPVLPVAVRECLARVGQLRRRELWARRTAAGEYRKAARLLHAEGLSLRDIGTILGVSFQRVHQLLSGPGGGER